MRRLDVGEGNYGREIEEDYDVMNSMSALQQRVLSNSQRCVAFEQKFMKYSDLWTHDMADALATWLTSNSTTSGTLS